MHPSANYIRYLVIKGLAELGRLGPQNPPPQPATDASKAEKIAYNKWHAATARIHTTVDNTLLKLNLPPISGTKYQLIYDDVVLPRGFRFFNLHHEPTREYMEEQGVVSIWSPTEVEMQVFTILKTKLAMDTIKILLMGNLPAVEVTSKVARKHRVEITADSVELFRYYFWNVDAIGFEDWELLLRGHHMRGMLLSTLHGSPDQARYRAGFNPKVDAKQSMRDIYRTLHFRIEGTRHLQDNEKTANLIGKLSKELVNVHGAIYGEGSALEDILRDFKAFVMETEEPDVTSIHDLAPEGNYSESGVQVISDGGNGHDDDGSELEDGGA
jgi:hypothetical protein